MEKSNSIVYNFVLEYYSIPLIMFLFVGCGFLTLFLFKKIFGYLSFNLPDSYCFASSMFILLFYVKISSYGTGEFLIIPFILVCSTTLYFAILKPSLYTGLLLGLSSFLCFITKESSFLFILTFILVFYFQFNGKNPITYKQFIPLFLGFICGLTPLIFICAHNQQIYKSIFSTDFLTLLNKQGTSFISFFRFFCIDPFRALIRHPLNVILQPFSALLIVLSAYNSYPWQKNIQTPKDTLFYTLIWFSIISLLFYGFFSVALIPQYHFYFLAISAPIALTYAFNEINQRISSSENKKAIIVWKYFGIAVFVAVFFYSIKLYNNDYSNYANEIESFTKEHKGVYSASTGAGIIATISKQKTIRFDGLNTDTKMQEFLRNQSEIQSVFNYFKIDYYVALNLKNENGCYNVREPVQNKYATNKSVSGWICQDPIYEHSINKKLKIQIFKLTQ